jgi:hypothetical protein
MSGRVSDESVFRVRGKSGGGRTRCGQRRHHKGNGAYAATVPCRAGAAQFREDRSAVLLLPGEPGENSAGPRSLVRLFLVACLGMPTPSSVTLSTTARTGFTGRHDRDGHRRRSSRVIGNRAALIKHVASSRPWAGLLSMPGSLCGCSMRRGSEQSRPFGPADRRRSARGPGARRARTSAGVVFEDSRTPRKLQILIDPARTPRGCGCDVRASVAQRGYGSEGNFLAAFQCTDQHGTGRGDRQGSR